MKKTFTINGREVEFSEVWATIDGERVPRILVHDTTDTYSDGDGIIGDLEALPETAEEAADALINEYLDTYTSGMNVRERNADTVKIIQKSSGIVLTEIVTNRSMTIEEACELMDIKIMRTEEDYQNGDGYDIEDLEMVY